MWRGWSPRPRSCLVHHVTFFLPNPAGIHPRSRVAEPGSRQRAAGAPPAGLHWGVSRTRGPVPMDGCHGTIARASAFCPSRSLLPSGHVQPARAFHPPWFPCLPPYRRGRGVTKASRTWWGMHAARMSMGTAGTQADRAQHEFTSTVCMSQVVQIHSSKFAHACKACRTLRTMTFTDRHIRKHFGSKRKKCLPSPSVVLVRRLVELCLTD